MKVPAPMTPPLTVAVLAVRFSAALLLLGIGSASTRRGPLQRAQALFADAGIVTMRPSDVPTYVEHGAADIGITGKDVLLEQAEREVYELLDLGYGHCRMVVAAREGDDALGESLRRLGRVRVATAHPASPRGTLPLAARRRSWRSRARWSWRCPPGWSTGSWTSPPAAGTLSENHLEVVEEIVDCTARLIADPVAHKLKAAEIDALVERMRSS